MRFRRTKDSNSKFRKNQDINQKYEEGEFFLESVMNMKNNEVMEIFKQMNTQDWRKKKP